MTERDFLYWLQGFLEMSEAKTLDEKQVQIIKDHIKLVAVKVTPDYPFGLTRHHPMLPLTNPISTEIIC